MHSSIVKQAVWDFFYDLDRKFFTDKRFMFAACFQNAYFEKFFLVRLKKTLRHDGRNIKIVLGSEVSLDWVDETFNSFDMFSDQDQAHIFLDAGSISIDCLESIYRCIARDFFQQKGKKVFLIFSKANELDDFTEKLSSVVFDRVVFDDICCVNSITPPMFWENDRVLSFIASELCIELSPDAHEYILQNIYPEVPEYFYVLNKIKLSKQPDAINGLVFVELKDSQGFVDKSFIDKFKTLSLIGKKQIKNAFKVLIENYDSDKDFAEFLILLISYLTNLADPSPLEKKSKKSKYDREILASCKLWSLEEISRMLRICSDLLISARKNNGTALDELKIMYVGMI